MYIGNFMSSQPHLEDVLALYDPFAHHSLVHQVGLCPRVASRAYLEIVLFSGIPTKRLRRATPRSPKLEG